ncbi:pyridoxamine 5'-phosphate oxidase family protein [Ilumatobacter sp.]|uniref:pyridoxamine 5'-phosphate oxidase family protein n=1 Tax=Ilumatobacter sp. TaxID=1967498 RepID=UPI003C362926
MIDRTGPDDGPDYGHGVPAVERPSMSDYGVPCDPDGALPWSWAEQRLVANKNFWVVTASAEGRPHSMPVWGVWMAASERFWFSCSPNSRKARNIVENPQCVVTVDDTVECISVEGKARLADPVEDAEAVDAAVDAYIVKYWDDPEVHVEMEAFVRSHTIIEVTPDRAFGIIERDDEFAQRATRWNWS